MSTAMVGPLFPSATASVHTCTASVVDSPGKDLLVTAAHCIVGSGAGVVFAPGYSAGREPFGTWRVTAAYAPPAWTVHHDPRADVAFLVVAPRTIGGRTVEVQQQTGGNPLGPAPARGIQVTVPAYALGANDRPILCRGAVTVTAGYPRFDCAGYVAGTSGAPWIADAVAGHPVVGVIGGLHQGGCTAAVSYSAAFGAAVTQTYRRAVARRPPSSLPAPGPDGCTSS